MPELPEVEDAARRLRIALVGRTIVAAQALHPALAKSLTEAACHRLTGRRVMAVTRRAKFQLVHLDDGQLLEIHFRMTGDWDIGRVSDPPPALERARFTCADDTRVSLVDGRAFGVIRLHDVGAFVMPPLGPEPLDDAFDAAVLASALRPKRGPIKPVLLDQRVVAGLGNIYAAEALWEARIRPDTPANSLSPARVARLRDAIQLVLNAAPSGRYYERKGTAIGTQSGTESGTESGATSHEEWRVYGREGEPCRRCGNRVGRIQQAGRSTFLCRKCQR